MCDAAVIISVGLVSSKYMTGPGIVNSRSGCLLNVNDGRTNPDGLARKSKSQPTRMEYDE